MREGLHVVQPTTVIRMAANCAARAMSCHSTNTLVKIVVSARIVATVRSCGH